MSAHKDSATIVGVGAAACAVCCAGPILGYLAALGLGTAAGLAAFGLVTLVVGAAITALVLTRRRRRRASCAAVTVEPTHVELSARPAR